MAIFWEINNEDAGQLSKVSKLPAIYIPENSESNTGLRRRMDKEPVSYSPPHNTTIDYPPYGRRD